VYRRRAYISFVLGKQAGGYSIIISPNTSRGGGKLRKEKIRLHLLRYISVGCYVDRHPFVIVVLINFICVNFILILIIVELTSNND